MFGITNTTRQIDGINRENIPLDILLSDQPVILKGLVNDWPLVQRGRRSAEQAIDYVKQFYNGKSAMIYYADPQVKGRFFYNADGTRLNYRSERGSVEHMLDIVQRTLDDANPPSCYLASNAIDSHFPGLAQHNDLTIPRQPQNYPVDPPLASIWMGNRSLASCHYDALENLACCVVGKRRFALFPPDQIENLYPGPLEPTPGGQAISMVDFYQPDFDKHPKFKQAIEAGQVAELDAGDALFLPSMWWHQVEGLERFNILINYWWSDAPRFMSSGMNALYHAILGVRDKPAHEKAAWKHIFDYYIFSQEGHAADHLPEQARGALATLDDLTARKIRARLINQLNR